MPKGFSEITQRTTQTRRWTRWRTRPSCSRRVARSAMLQHHTGSKPGCRDVVRVHKQPPGSTPRSSRARPAPPPRCPTASLVGRRRLSVSSMGNRSHHGHERRDERAHHVQEHGRISIRLRDAPQARWITRKNTRIGATFSADTRTAPSSSTTSDVRQPLMPSTPPITSLMTILPHQVDRVPRLDRPLDSHDAFLSR